MEQKDRCLVIAAQIFALRITAEGDHPTEAELNRRARNSVREAKELLAVIDADPDLMNYE